MQGFPGPFGADETEGSFDPETAFFPDHLPEPGPFLDGHRVLTGEDHIAFHTNTTALFEERGVYDVTFGYNLARLNRDTRHPDAGYRYAVDANNEDILRAEFTPTTQFCPQAHPLTVASFRAWNGLIHETEYDLIKVRVSEMHQRSERVNEHLRWLESVVEETGEIPAAGPDAQGYSSDLEPGIEASKKRS